MKIDRFQLYRYSLTLRRALPLRSRPSLKREGMLLKLRAGPGAIGWGDIAPLPGYSKESLADAADALSRFLEAGPHELADVQWILSGAYRACGPPLSPSAAFGFECACLDLVSGDARLPLRSMLADEPRDSLSINGLLAIDDETLFDRAAPMVQTGAPAIKVKVGRGAPVTEADRLRELVEHVTGDLPLRLDANCAWSLDEAAAFCRGVSTLPIEYLEEPLSDPSALTLLCGETSVFFALDESLGDEEGRSNLAVPQVRAAILKPSMIGGFGASLRLARQAAGQGVYTVISSMFESGVGTLALAQIAACLVPADRSCGLDPHRWIQEDVVESGLPQTGWEIDLKALDRVLPVMRYDRLEEYAND